MANFSDAFTRADENPLAGNWTTITGETALKIVSNQVVPSNDALDCSARVNSVSFSADHYASAILSTASTGGSGAGPGLAVRVASGARTYYRFIADHDLTNNCQIIRFLAGSTPLVTFTQAWTNGDRWELRVVGPANAAVLTMYLNGSLVQTYTDNSSLASGSPGMAYSSTAASSTLDDFLAEDIPLTEFDYSNFPKFLLAGGTTV
jgi:hypothetical protein